MQTSLSSRVALAAEPAGPPDRQLSARAPSQQMRLLGKSAKAHSDIFDQEKIGPSRSCHCERRSPDHSRVSALPALMACARFEIDTSNLTPIQQFETKRLRHYMCAPITCVLRVARSRARLCGCLLYTIRTLPAVALFTQSVHDTCVACSRSPLHGCVFLHNPAWPAAAIKKRPFAPHIGEFWKHHLHRTLRQMCMHHSMCKCVDCCFDPFYNIYVCIRTTRMHPSHTPQTHAYTHAHTRAGISSVRTVTMQGSRRGAHQPHEPSPIIDSHGSSRSHAVGYPCRMSA